MFVIVGEAGTVLTSPDGITWTSHTSGTSNLLECIAYGNGLFVAAGYNGIVIRIAYTSDNWQIAGGFTEKAISSSKTSYKLFDGKWLRLNSSGTVTWGDSA
jgi:hypothetical protein